MGRTLSRTGGVVSQSNPADDTTGALPCGETNVGDDLDGAGAGLDVDTEDPCHALWFAHLAAAGRRASPLDPKRRFKFSRNTGSAWAGVFGGSHPMETTSTGTINVSFTGQEIARDDAYCNYKEKGCPSTEAPGASVLYKYSDGTGDHTYSVFERGLDMFITAYHYLDIVPKDRDENNLNSAMEWLRPHDEYDK